MSSNRPIESVWDYPRPPKLERTDERIHIIHNGQTIVDTTGAYRVLETSHPPTYYVPQCDTEMRFLQHAPGKSLCEWKGQAVYWDLVVGGQDVHRVAWSYPRPTQQFTAITDFLAFYPSKVDECYVDDAKVEAQEGDFYGGWITPYVKGPFKGGPGTLGW